MTAEELAAVIAAVQAMAPQSEPAPAQPAVSAWKRAARTEGVSPVDV